jgi:hypothetical protein
VLAGFLSTNIGQSILLTILMGGGTGFGFGVIFGPTVYRWFLKQGAQPQIERLQKLMDDLVAQCARRTTKSSGD